MNITQQQELRYQFAGMAMQALIKIAAKMDTTEKTDYLDEQNDLLSSLLFQMQQYSPEIAVAIIAREFADALIAELDRKGKP